MDKTLEISVSSDPMLDLEKSSCSVTSSVSSSQRTTQHCPTHSTKRGDLYCVTCEMVICSKCLTECRQHARHTVDTVKETYLRRFQETQVKLETLDRYIEIQRSNSDLRKRLLEELVRNKEELVCRLDQINREAKEELEKNTIEKLEQLDPSLLTIKLKEYYRDEIAAEIAGLNEGDFVVQHADLNYRCDSLMSTAVHRLLEDPTNFLDVSCSLLPKIDMDSHCIQIVRNSSIDITYFDRYSYKWNLQLESIVPVGTSQKMCVDKLLINVKSEGPGKLKGNFRVVLKIVHSLPLKTITKAVPFKLLGLSKYRQITLDIGDLYHLQNGGFITKDNMLQLQIGVGPEDPVTERNCYKQTLEIYRTQINTLNSDFINWKKFNISYFCVEECPDLKSKRSKTQCSPVTMDEFGVKWQFKVTINGKLNKGFVGVFISKKNGSKEWYDYFVELINPKSENHNRIVKGCHLFDVAPLELPQFMTIAFLDPFIRNGTLRLRFGTTKESHEQLDLSNLSIVT